ncbi:MAG: FAD-binding oxidoreductase [Planctomycetaceae bacterium]|nr:FAD-binding oxidoreductase [Planctomycetaceae bacterium]
MAMTNETLWSATLSAHERAELNSSSGTIDCRSPDVLVVGGGIVGLSIAYFLAEQRAQVQLIESGSIAAGASGANAGGVWPNDQGPAHAAGFQEFAFQSRDLWGRLSLRPEFDFDWRVNGILNVNAARIGPLADTARKLQSQGYAVQAVDGEQIASLEPHLRAGLAAGLHLPSEAHLHPVKAALSLARAARRHGAAIATGVAALKLLCREQRIVGVSTTAGPIEPHRVVSATGWSAAWLGSAEVWLPPLRPVGGQLISTDPQPPLLRGSVADEFLVLQLRSGEIVTGGGVFESDQLAPEPALSAEFAAAARKLIPALHDVPFTRVWRGLRPGTPDDLPIIDRAGSLENLWLACGHFKNGVLLAPATGKSMAEWLTSGTRPDCLAPFGAGRFR